MKSKKLIVLLGFSQFAFCAFGETEVYRVSRYFHYTSTSVYGCPPEEKVFFDDGGAGYVSSFAGWLGRHCNDAKPYNVGWCTAPVVEKSVMGAGPFTCDYNDAYIWGSPRLICYNYSKETTECGNTFVAPSGNIGIYPYENGTVCFEGATRESRPEGDVCVLIAPDIPKESCPSKSRVGNPIDVAAGRKIEEANDYDDFSGGILNFTRWYNSDKGGFGSEEASFVPPNNQEVQTCSAKKTILFGKEYYPCYSRIMEQSKALFKDSEGYDYVFSWPAGVPLSFWNKDRLKFFEGAYLLERRDSGLIYVFGVDGKIQRKSSIDGRSVFYSYSEGYLSGVTDDYGRSLRFDYGDDGALVKMVDPAGGETIYEHEANSQAKKLAGVRLFKPIQVSYPGGGVKKYFWNESDNSSGSQSTLLLTGKLILISYFHLKVAKPALSH